MSPQTPKFGPLSDSDVSIFVEWVLQTAVQYLLYGANIVISFTVIYLLTTTSTRMTRGQIGLLSLTIFMLSVSTISVSLTTVFILLEIPLNAINPPDTISLISNVEIAGIYMDRLNFLTCDGIVVWRAWILYPRNLVAKTVLIMCIMGSLAGAFVNVGFKTEETLRDIDDTGGPLEILELTLPLLITNLVSTLMIAYKACSVMRVQKIIWFLVESGFFYCTIWIGYTVVSLLAGGHDMQSIEVYASAMPILSATYPLLVILVVAHEKSKEATTDGMSVTQSIKFASRNGTEREIPGDGVEMNSQLCS
ncbi:hypothetical protein K435DRAFT_960207 [Dendrothele bispora CBS 962.96]|uniref:Uncharacterized protein n=1 Tax=Dendrothele bispora (strain CBS 962.96) TaxID=1314807 RepID=A0A4S8MUQ2_DENBC|nr:hypothetical protein K435DRAFT_960207 [Dendrothele bispora CBS 962.96]